MSVSKVLYHLLPSAVSLGIMLGNIQSVRAADLSAHAVMEKMSAEERHAYLAGVVEGSAYARYAADGKEVAGMNCIYEWFYHDPKATDLIYAAFDRYPDYTPGAIIATLAKRKCN